MVAPYGGSCPTVASIGCVYGVVISRKRYAELKLSAQEEITSLSFSPDGRLLRSIAGDGSARLWDVRPAAPLGTTFPAGASAVALNGDGSVAAALHGLDALARLPGVEHVEPQLVVEAARRGEGPPRS